MPMLKLSDIKFKAVIGRGHRGQTPGTLLLMTILATALVSTGLPRTRS